MTTEYAVFPEDGGPPLIILPNDEGAAKKLADYFAQGGADVRSRPVGEWTTYKA